MFCLVRSNIFINVGLVSLLSFFLSKWLIQSLLNDMHEYMKLHSSKWVQYACMDHTPSAILTVLFTVRADSFNVNYVISQPENDCLT